MKNLVLWLVLITACGQGGGTRVAGSLDGGKLADVKMTPEGKDRVRVEFTLLDKSGKPVSTFVSPSVGPRVELQLRSNTPDDDLLCKASEFIHEKDHDPKTGRVTLVTQFFAHPTGDCITELRKKGYQGKPLLALKVSENGMVIRHQEALTSFEVGTDRIAELDAEIAALAKAVAEIDPVVVLPKCTAEHLGTVARLEAIDQPSFMDTPPPGSDAAWTWANTWLFGAIDRYMRHEDDNPAETLAALKAARKLFVYVAVKHQLPEFRSPTEFTSGIFDGGLYLLDRDAGKATCAIPFVVTSSPSINYTRTSRTQKGETVVTSSDGKKQLLADFKRNFAAAVTKAMADAGLAKATPALPRIDE